MKIKVLIPALLSVATLSMVIACGQKNEDSVNARSGKPCDSTMRMCDKKTEAIYAKLGFENKIEEFKKILESVKDEKVKIMNKDAASKIRNLELEISDSRAKLTIIESSGTTELVGKLKDGSAELDNDVIPTTAEIECLTADVACPVAKVVIHKNVPRQMVSGTATVKNKTVAYKGETNTVEQSTTVIGIVLTTRGTLTTEQKDLNGKSDAFKKLYEMIQKQSGGAAGENSIKEIVTQSSIIANGKAFTSIVILSNENEAIGLEGHLQLVNPDLKGRTSVKLSVKLNQTLLKKVLPTGEAKNTIMSSLDDLGVTLVSIQDQNKLGISFAFKKTDKAANEEPLLTNLLLTPYAQDSKPKAKEEAVEAVEVVETAEVIQ